MPDTPFFPVAVMDLLGDTDHLSHAEFGLYMRMLARMWVSPGGQIPRDPDWLCRRFQVPREDYATVLAPIIKEFCQPTDKFLTQKRLQKELTYVTERSRKHSEAGKLRWTKGKDDSLAKASHKPSSSNGAAEQEPGLAPTLIPTLTPIDSVSKKDTESETTKGASRFKFEGQVIRLTPKDFDQWTEAYEHLELRAELTSHDAYLASQPVKDQKHWFIRTSTHLRNQNHKAAQAAKPNEPREIWAV